MNTYHQQLIREIDWVIGDYAKFDNNQQCLSLYFDDLSIVDQTNLSKAYIESIDRDVYECFFNPTQLMKDDDMTCCLLSLLKNNTTENKDKLINLILERSSSAYAAQIQELIDERCIVLTDREMEEHGLYSVQIDETDYEWRKFG